MVDSFSIGCEFCGCTACPSGYRVSKPSGIVSLEGIPVTTCTDLERQGLEGLLPKELCTDEVRLDPLFRATCGCPETPSLLYTNNPFDDNDNETRSPTSNPAPLLPDLSSQGEGSNALQIFKENPIYVACIVAGALAVAGIYLVCQLRRTTTATQPSVVMKDAASTIKAAEEGVGLVDDEKEEIVDTTHVDETEVDATDGDSQVDNSPEYTSTPSQRMIYVLDHDDVSDIGSVFSYNIQL